MKNALILTLLLVSLIFAGCIYLSEPTKFQRDPSIRIENQTTTQTDDQNTNGAIMQEPATPGESQGSQTPLSLTSSAFSNNGVIPNKYSCNGDDVIPPLQFTGVPSNTQSLALIMDDPDAVPVVGFVYTHWVVFDISPIASEIPEGVQIGIVGAAGSGQKKYEGPCPPPGETHTYSFKLYALDSELDLQEGVSKEQLETAMQGHVLAQAELKGMYSN